MDWIVLGEKLNQTLTDCMESISVLWGVEHGGNGHTDYFIWAACLFPWLMYMA